jgi:GNAT superfamily N-acetyltransferase
VNPVVPLISVRPLTIEDAPTLANLLRELIASAPYSVKINENVLVRELFAENPPALFPIRWQQHAHLGAWRAGQLVGFIDLATGLDRDNLDLPDYHPLGMIRFLALPDRQELVPDVADALFAAAQRFWQETSVAYVKAFHISSGYPCFQAGAGMLPGEWGEHVRVLTLQGFRFSDRYSCLARPLSEQIEEVVPQADLSLVYRGNRNDRTYQIYYRRTEWVGSARMVRVIIPREAGVLRVAYLADLQIVPNWRQRDIGKWLFRRLINDSTIQGYQQMVAHLAHEHSAAMNLLVQHGFQELNYRGYSFDKRLTT